MGDFSDLLISEDKNGRVAHLPHLFRGFREAIDSCGFSDVQLCGHRFTWSRGRGTSDFVEERLDRAFGSHQWQQLFPLARLLNLVAPV